MPFAYFCIYFNNFLYLYCTDQREEYATIKINTVQVPSQSSSEKGISKTPIFRWACFSIWDVWIGLGWVFGLELIGDYHYFITMALFSKFQTHSTSTLCWLEQTNIPNMAHLEMQNWLATGHQSMFAFLEVVFCLCIQLRIQYWVFWGGFIWQFKALFHLGPRM